MKQYALWLLPAALLLGLAGCEREPDPTAATAIPAPPTLAATEELVLSTAEVTAEPTAAPATAEPPTDEPPTEEPATDDGPQTTAEATADDRPPTAEPTATAAPSATALVGTGGEELFAPGQVDGTTLAIGGATSYLVQGRRFQPIILFVEPDAALDVALAAYTGDVGGQTTPGGVTPLAAADNALAGRPEILVLSPEVDGLFTLVVRAASGEGNLSAHLFDLTTPAPGVAIQQPDMLAAGTEKVYTVASRGARPIIAVVDPTDQADVALDVIGGDGALLTTANYSGPGGAETAYVLPLGTAEYGIKVREVNAAAVNYQILVITLE